jgi:hypothetical protein
MSYTSRADGVTSFTLQPNVSYAVLLVLVENVADRDVFVSLDVSGTEFIHNYRVPRGNTFVFDRKLLLDSAETLTVSATDTVNVVISGANI